MNRPPLLCPCGGPYDLLSETEAAYFVSKRKGHYKYSVIIRISACVSLNTSSFFECYDLRICLGIK